MTNQKHSAFDIVGDPFTRGTALVADIDPNSPPQVEVGDTGVILHTFDVSSAELKAGDLLRMKHSYVWQSTTDGVDNASISVEIVYDSGSPAAIPAYTGTVGSGNSPSIIVEHDLQLLDNTTQPNDSITSQSFKATYYDNVDSAVTGGVLLLVDANAGNIVTINIKASLTGSTSVLKLASATLEFFGGEA